VILYYITHFIDIKYKDSNVEVIVKLQSKVQTSVLGLGVDFVLPLSQQEQEQEEQEEPHQNIPEGSILEVLNFTKCHTKPNQTHATPLPTLPPQKN